MTRIEHSRAWPSSLALPRWLQQGPPYQGVVPIAAAAVIALVLTRALWSTLEFGQIYNDLVVGGISWGDFDKTRDFRGLALFVSTLVGASIGISLLVTRVVKAAASPAVRSACDALLVFALLPALWRFGVVLANPMVKSTPKDAALPIIVALLVIGILPRFRGRLTAEAVVATGGRVLLAVGLAIFSGLGVGLAIARLVPDAALALGKQDDVFAIAPAIVVAAIGLLTLLRTSSLRDADRLLDWLLLIVQIPLPLLVFAVLPTPMTMDGQFVENMFTPALPMALFGYVALALATLAVRWRRWRATPETQRTLRDVCAPLCLAGVAVVAIVPLQVIPHYMRDLFQAGEELLPWQQWREFGKLPFVDFAPIHGLMPLLRGWIGEVFLTNTAADFMAAEYVLLGLSALATYLAFHYTAGPMVALFLTAFTTPLNNRFLFLTPALVILVWPYLLDRPRRWLVTWLTLCGFMVFYNASIGSALAIGTSPAAAWMVWRLWRLDRRALWQLAGGVAAVACVALAISPIRQMTLGLVTFILENASTNELVSGIPWHGKLPARERYPVAGTTFFWEFLRLSWLVVVVVALVQFWRQFGRDAARDRRLLWLSALIPLTLLLTAVWSLNRVDAGHLSRTGELSHTVVGYLLPLLLILGRPLLSLPSLVAGLAVLGGFVVSVDPYEGQAPLVGSLAERAFQVRILPSAPATIRGAEVGLPQLGHIRIDPDPLNRILALKSELGSLLRPGETFFDLTSNSAYYYYLDLPVPALYSAHYVAANSRMQARMLEQLRADPPPVVMISPRDDHDGGPPPLRSYLLYREFALKYAVVERGQFVFLVDPARAPEAGLPGSPAQVALLEKHVGWSELREIPAAWGRNWNRLAERFEEQKALTPAAESNLQTDDSGHPISKLNAPLLVSYPLDAPTIAGTDAEYVLIRLKNVSTEETEESRQTRVGIRWTEADGTAAAPGFWVTATGETLVVPLGASPHWLLSQQHAKLNLEIHPNNVDAEPLVIEEVRLLRLKPPI